MNGKEAAKRRKLERRQEKKNKKRKTDPAQDLAAKILSEGHMQAGMVIEKEDPPAKSKKWPLLLGIGILSCAATLGVTYFRSSDLEEKIQPSHSESVALTYESAKKDKSLRKLYCNHLFINREKYGDSAWDSFRSIEYDPGFKRMEEERKRLGIKNPYQVYANDESKNTELATIPFLYGARKKNSVWIDDALFDYCRTEDEFLSLLDNEASSAILCEKGKAHFQCPNKVPKDIKLLYKAIELISFDLQYTKILDGKRKVSNRYIAGFVPNSKDLFSDVEKISKSNSPDADYAKAIIDEIRKRPTKKYFE